jgi:DNA repair exonuclease SbcCD ATPase subunit
MLTISGLDLNDVISFKKVSVDFKEGLTYVRGINKDSDLARPTGNGTGKSLFFSAIPNVVYAAPPLALRKKSRKDLLGRKGSNIGFILRPSADSPEYEIIQTGSKYTIFEDGKDLEVNTIPRSEAFIKKLFPISEIDFYSRCYVSTQKPYALLRDSDSDRLQHIIDIALLDQYSDLQKFFSLKASAIKDNEIRLSVLEQQLAGVKKKLRESKSDITKVEYRKLKTQYDGYAEKIEKLQSNKFKLLTQQQALQSLLTVEKELDELRSKYTFKAPPSKQLKALRADKDAASEWETYVAEVAKASKSQQRLRLAIKKIEKSLPEEATEGLSKRAKTLNKELNTVTSEIAKMEGIETQVEELREEQTSLQEEFDGLEVDESKVVLEKDYGEFIAEAKIRLKLEALLEHEDSHASSGTCPTCQAEIDYDAIRSIVRGERKALNIAVKNKKAQQCLIALKDVKRKLAKLSFDAPELKALRTKKKQLAKDVETVEENLDKFEELSSLRNQLRAIEIPVEPECEKPALDLSDIEEGIDLCHEIEKHLKAKAAIIENHSDFESFRSAKAVSTENTKVGEQIAKISKEIRTLESAQADCAGKVSSYEQYANTVKIYQGEQETTQAEIDKLRPSVDDKKLVTILSKAYGTKGLRAYAANAFCNLLQTNLNHYRDLIFAEPFEFSVEASDSGVSIMVDRNNGKPDAVSDVRHLSGAESECFALLCAASLITLTPDSRKLNMIVLDEPTSHMHQVTRELFNQKFVPFLRELVPSIFIITPHDDDCSPNSAEWVVEKSKGVSRLIQM